MLFKTYGSMGEQQPQEGDNFTMGNPFLSFYSKRICFDTLFHFTGQSKNLSAFTADTGPSGSGPSM